MKKNLFYINNTCSAPSLSVAVPVPNFQKIPNLKKVGDFCFYIGLGNVGYILNNRVSEKETKTIASVVQRVKLHETDRMKFLCNGMDSVTGGAISFIQCGF